MMAIGDIVRAIRSLDSDRRSPVADSVAAAWGYPAGMARHWRSSASHVFVLGDGPGRVYLRFVPGGYRSRPELEAVAVLMRRLGEHGLAVAQPAPSAAGELVETVTTTMGDVHAMVVAAAPGEQIDVDDLKVDRARAWGAALAHLHATAGAMDVELPGPFPQLARVAEVFPHDSDLLSAADELQARLGRLPRDDTQFGVVHGDFELDNLCWQGAMPTSFDFDEAARSWFAADLCYALRDLDGDARQEELEAAFLAGYADVRQPPDGEHMRLFASAHAACSAVRTQLAIGEAQTDDPQWTSLLRDKLGRHVARQRALALAGVRG